ncbi:hypothetical protein BDZ45DRAFT_724467 [Acephala macrosclerotiorum]|nr:hypothetical protein BDZ45DRAFT_724467 [Acephala macrosclerotiorum]
MYKDRIHKWGFDKKHKERDMLAILRKKTEREAVGKRTAFRVRGQVVTIEQVHHYLKRKKSIPNHDSQPPTPSDLSYRTPSPAPAEYSAENGTQPINSDSFWQQGRTIRTDMSLLPSSRYTVGAAEVVDIEWASAPLFIEDEAVIQMTLKSMQSLLSDDQQIPRSPSTPLAILVPERLLLTIKTYVNGSFEKKTWLLDDDGDLTSLMILQNGGYMCLPDFDDSYCAAAEFLEMGLYSEFRRTLSRAFNLVKDIVRSEHPQFLEYLLDCLLFFKREQHQDINDLLVRFVCEIATLCGPQHPLVQICQLIARLEPETFEQVIIQSWECTIDDFGRIIGLSNTACLKARTAFISGVHGFLDLLEEERLLRALLERFERDIGSSSEQTFEIIGRLATNLNRQGRYVEAEELVLVALVQVDKEPDSNYRSWHNLNSLTLRAESQYYQDKKVLAEDSQRQALKLARNVWGWDGPLAIPIMVGLYRWLREWQREEEADELKLEIEEAIGVDEIDLELYGH